MVSSEQVSPRTACTTTVDPAPAGPGTSRPLTPNERRSLLLVVAHPDDETFMFGGTAARYAAEGVEVHLIVGCFDDRGEAADVRRDELRRACATLGITTSTVLEFDAPEGPFDLSEGRVRRIANRIEEHMERIDPSVVVTFDATGGTGELDHILIGRATTEAFDSMIAKRGSEAQTRKLYVGHFGKRLMRFGVAALRFAPGRDPRRFGPKGSINLVAALNASPLPTTFVEVRRHLEVRRQAALCHMSQLRGAPWFLRRYELLPARVRGRLFPREVYSCVRPPAPQEFRESGFFGDA